MGQQGPSDELAIISCEVLTLFGLWRGSYRSGETLQIMLAFTEVTRRIQVPYQVSGATLSSVGT